MLVTPDSAQTLQLASFCMPQVDLDSLTRPANCTDGAPEEICKIINGEEGCCATCSQSPNTCA